MNYTKKVLCLEDYYEDDTEFWSAGIVYDAVAHRDGTWSIETNLLTEGRVGKGYMLDNFEEYFSDITKGAELLDAVRLAYYNGYFTITDTYGYGCYGVHCETPSGGFYFGGLEADEAESAEYYVREVGTLGVCQGIAGTIKSFIEDASFPEEAMLYLSEMKEFCTVEGKCAVKDVLDKWIDEAEKAIERDELDR